jgi:hypothetical protein
VANGHEGATTAKTELLDGNQGLALCPRHACDQIPFSKSRAFPGPRNVCSRSREWDIMSQPPLWLHGSSAAAVVRIMQKERIEG